MKLSQALSIALAGLAAAVPVSPCTTSDVKPVHALADMLVARLVLSQTSQEHGTGYD